MSFGNFFKGDKKKKKKADGSKGGFATGPTFVAPSVAPKGKGKNYPQ